MDKKNSVLIQVSVLIAIIAVGFGVYFSVSKKPKIDNEVSCTMEAKICPDGTAVGRTGPSCDFALCPTSTTVIATSTTSKIGNTPLRNEWLTYKNTKYGFSFKYPALSKVTFATSSSSVGVNVIVKLRDANIAYAGNGKAISFQVYEKGSFIQYTEASACKSFAHSEFMVGGKILDIAEHERCRGEEGIVSSTHYINAIISLSDTEDLVFTASLGSIPFGGSGFVTEILKTLSFIVRE
ncbi:MAG: hypothetical protein NTZ36_01585 [Candidatus Jorgensenbacteria bacterium]|nr:hypothetical protein [Candidatus Jorgensenbacteria bacterium]